MEKKFNREQEQAVKHVDGSCLVLAGPGSGKTFVLTNRILNLILEENVRPDSILVITFTRASAFEMKDRFKKLLDEQKCIIDDLPTFGTFHSVFFEILKNDFGYNQNSLLKDDEDRFILSKVLEKHKNIKINDIFISNTLKEIKDYKQSLERNEIYKPKSINFRLFNNILNDFQKEMFHDKKLDFSDMITMCYELLKSDKKILSRYQNKYKYVLIDEFQDINKSQYELIKLICKSKNLFVVGDDDQSIYKFRGSHPRVMNDFLKDYKHSKIIYLNKNYRCAKKIVWFSNYMIKYNKERFDKELIANRKEVGKFEIKAFNDSIEENKYIIDLIRHYNSFGLKLSDMAILYRTNILLNSIKRELNKHNINYIVKGENLGIYDNFAVKDIISYLKYAIYGESSSDLMNIANKPLRYISRNSINYKNTTIYDLIEYYKDKDYVLKNIYKFRHDLDIIKNSITAIAIKYIRRNINYDEYLLNFCKTNNIDYDEIKDILDVFEEEAIGYNDIDQFLKHIECEKHKDVNTKNEDAVNLMTFHLSKGLEYKVVFIIDANDGIIPHTKSLRENDLEIERRLLYVGMTRAKDFLHIFFTTRRFGKNFRPSRFILEAIGGQDGQKIQNINC